MSVLLLLLIATGISAASDTDLFPLNTPDSYANLRREKDAMARKQAQDLALKEQRFIESFNRLAKALDDFSDTYKVKRVIDVKKIKSIKEAYGNLERADAWFKIE